MERSDTDSEYESDAPGPPTKKKLRTEIVHKKCVTTDSKQDLKSSETQSTDNESRRGLPLQIIGDIVIEHDNNQMEVDDGNLTIDHVQKPRQIIGVRLNKVPKTSAERGREFRARKALLKQQCKQQQEPDAIVEIATEDIQSAGPSEKNQVPEPSEITTIEKRAKSAEATRRWREKKKGVSESSKKRAKTAAQRMREYRERKKLAKKILLEQQSDQDLDAIVSTSSSQVNQRADPSTINSISAELTRIGNSQSQQQIEGSERTREYRERRNDNVNIEFNNPSGNNEEQSDLCDLTLKYDDILKHKKAHETFDRKFWKNPFGYSCTVCDRLWFKNDLKKASDNYEDLLKKITDQRKIIVAKVYHYFEQEYEELKKTIEGIDQTPLSMFRQRTALATGVSETMVEEILQEEARQNEEMHQQTLLEQSLARKRPRQTHSSIEDGSSDENIADDDDDETETLVIKEEVEEPVEPYNEEPEIFVEMPNVKVEPGVSGDNQELTDPISVDFKTEPLNEEATTSTETAAVQRASNSYKKRKTKRNTDAPSDASTSPAIAASSASFVPPATAVLPGTSATPERRLILLEDGEVKMEQIEIDEEGFS